MDRVSRVNCEGEAGVLSTLTVDDLRATIIRRRQAGSARTFWVSPSTVMLVPLLDWLRANEVRPTCCSNVPSVIDVGIVLCTQVGRGDGRTLGQSRCGRRAGQARLARNGGREPFAVARLHIRAEDVPGRVGSRY